MEHRLIDIHMHLIPGVDDGAEDMEHALTMFLHPREQGVTDVFATPHSSAFDWYPQETADRFQQLRKWIPETFLGCEVYCEDILMDAVVRALKEKTYPTMNGTDYVLIEFPQGISLAEILSCAKVLIGAGYRPIIAHVERYHKLLDNISQIDVLCQLGCLLQVNAYSLFDEMNNGIKNWARRLAQEEKVHFLGTDAHRTTHRPPSVLWGMNWLYENCRETYADKIAWGNAQAMLMRK